MFAASRGSLLSLLLLASACGRGTRDEGSAAASTAPSSLPTSASTKPVCEERVVACSNPTTATRCAEGAWRTEPCGTVPCVEGGCLTLDGAARPGLLVPIGAKWLDAWTVRGPLTEDEVATLTSAEGRPFEEDGEPRRAFCGPEGIVTDSAWSRGRAGQRSQLLTARAWVASGVDAELRVGLRGRVRVWVRGRLVLDRTSQDGLAPMPDEELVAIRLESGANPLAVAVTPSGDADPAVMMRLGARDGRLLDLAWEMSHGARCSLGDLARVTLEPKLVREGFAPTLRLDARGLVPSAGALSVAVYRHHAAPPARAGHELPAPLVETAMTRDDLVQGKSLEFQLPAVRVGEQPLRVELGSEGSRTVRPFTLRHHRGVSDRLAELAARYLHGSSRDPRPIELSPAIPEATRASFEHALRTMVAAAENGHPDTSWLRARGDALAREAEALDAGRDPYADAVGVVRRAYRSPLDGKLQPYLLFVTSRIRRAKGPLPLVVVAHGLNHDPAMALRIVFGEGPEEDEDRGIATRHLPHLPDVGALVLAPGGYRDAGPRTVGEADILDAVDDVRAHYPVDPQRITLTGYSLGGTVSFTVPLHYPDRFAAAAPLCGYPNLLTYGEVARSPRLPFEEVMLSRRFIGNYAENGMYLPLHIVHGANDGPQRSAVLADRYRELGYARAFRVEPDLGHNVWDEAYDEARLLAWLATRRRPERPTHVRLRTGELRYDRAYWVRLHARESEDAPASIDARYVADRKLFEITTGGVRAFAIDVTGFDAEAALVDGHRVSFEKGDGLRFFVRAGDRFEASGEPDFAGRKRPGVAGPLDDVLRHRLVVVYGTQVPAEREANRLVAEHWASHDSWAGASFPVVADHELSEADRDGRSLVLIGRPETNLVSARLAAAFPVSFDADALVFGGRRHAGRDVGVSMIRPHPANPSEYVVLHAGVGHSGTLSSRHLPRLAPDYLVYDEGIRAARGGELLGERKVLDGGFFDETWRIRVPEP